MIGRRLTLGLVALVLASTACASGPSATRSEVDLSGLDVANLALPPSYSVLNTETGTRAQVLLHWSQIGPSQATHSTCGPERLWVWSVPAPTHPSELGDPTVRLYVCVAADASSATRFFDSVPIQETMVPQNDNYAATSVSVGRLGLRADQAAVACVWGLPTNCRAWAFFARYGSHVVSAHVISAGKPASISQDAFGRLVGSIDQSVQALLAPG